MRGSDAMNTREFNNYMKAMENSMKRSSKTRKPSRTTNKNIYARNTSEERKQLNKAISNSNKRGARNRLTAQLRRSLTPKNKREEEEQFNEAIFNSKKDKLPTRKRPSRNRPSRNRPSRNRPSRKRILNALNRMTQRTKKSRRPPSLSKTNSRKKAPFYWEHQSRLECGRHSINNVLGTDKPVYNKGELINIAKQYRNRVQAETGLDLPLREFADVDSGFYDRNVIVEALDALRGIHVFDRDGHGNITEQNLRRGEPTKAGYTLRGIIVNQGNSHWYGYRLDKGQWWDVNSLSPGPQMVGSWPDVVKAITPAPKRICQGNPSSCKIIFVWSE